VEDRWIVETQERDFHQRPAGRWRRLGFALLALPIAGAWLIPLWGSLWLDETGTFWAIKDGFAEMVDRSLRFQGQSPLYYLLAWMARSILGDSEVALRVPSLIASIVAVVLLFRLSDTLLGRAAAWPTTIVFTVMESVRLVGTDARPYSLALALSVAATLRLVRWLDSGRDRDAVGYVLLAAAVVYAHYFFALILLGHVVYILYRTKRSSSVGRKALLIAASGMVILLVPLIPQLISLIDRRGTLSIGTDLGIRGIARALLPVEMIAAIVAFGAARYTGKRSRPIRSPDRSTFVLIATWAFLTPMSMYVVSLFTDVVVFLPRYLVAATPGSALLSGWLLSHLERRGAFRSAVIATIVVAALVVSNPLASSNWITRHSEQWRDAIAYVNQVVDDPGTPVLIRAGFIESQQIDWLTDPEKMSWLMAPIAAYPVEGRPIPMPGAIDSEARVGYVRSVLENEVASERQFVFVTNVDNPYGTALRVAGEEDGFIWRSRMFGVTEVMVFQRDHQP